jgi:hypothetical protein
MNGQPRVELLEAITDLCRHYPHWRLGQLVANVAGWADQDAWDIEDEQLLAAVQMHMHHLERSEVECPKNCEVHP